MRVAIYLRVSTTDQTTDNHRIMIYATKDDGTYVPIVPLPVEIDAAGAVD
jgi:DNA invertase Pin-like site-specific DNA recombinase